MLKSMANQVKLFRGGLVFEAHRLLGHSTLGLRVVKKKEKEIRCGGYSKFRTRAALQGYLAHKKTPPP